MARDRASIRINMWADDDWRNLTPSAQHLYMVLLSHPTLTYAGVADWRPGRIASLSRSWTANDVLESAEELEQSHFILVDHDSEEVLIRSFVKHDGLMKQPKLAVAMANAYAAVASSGIRQVIAFEVQKLHSREPNLSAWEAAQVKTILSAKGSPIDTFTPAVTPAFTPAVTPKRGQALAEPTTTGTTTETSTEVDGKKSTRGTRLPSDWVPSVELRAWAAAKRPDLNVSEQFDAFRDYWNSIPGSKGVKLDWDATWRSWIRNAYASKVPDTSKPTVSGVVTPVECSKHPYYPAYDCARCAEELAVAS